MSISSSVPPAVLEAASAPEVVYPDGWRLERTPLALIAPDGTVHSHAGDVVTVVGAETDDFASICQIGPIVRASEVLARSSHRVAAGTGSGAYGRMGP